MPAGRSILGTSSPVCSLGPGEWGCDSARVRRPGNPGLRGTWGHRCLWVGEGGHGLGRPRDAPPTLCSIWALAAALSQMPPRHTRNEVLSALWVP